MSKENQTAIKRELATLLAEKELRNRYCKIDTLFPNEGKYCRAKYPRHTEFMAAGAKFNQRAMIAANRTGKTVMGAYEMACHLTGQYPPWWTGKRFTQAISAWAASVSNEATKNIIQQELLGSPMDFGSGLIPKKLIEFPLRKKSGVTDAIETVYVKHVSGDLSCLDFKSYEQGSATFQGTKKQVIWLDEEPSDYGIYSECLTRTAGGSGGEGLIYCTFTPLFGLSDVVLSFLPDGQIPPNGVDPRNPHKFASQINWDEVPHLSEQWKKETLASYREHERAARSKGIPSLGQGAIYPYDEDMMVIKPREIPPWWPRAYGMDVGWNRTAVIWGALNPDDGALYLYSEHYLGQELPAIHASAIKGRGDWITGAIDPASNSTSQTDGLRLLDLYEAEGLDLVKADNAVESGIYTVGQKMASGQLKVFNTCTNWIKEFRVYRRDEKGKIVKKNDHLMDATRYLVMTGLDEARCLPDPDANQHRHSYNDSERSEVTGY